MLNIKPDDCLVVTKAVLRCSRSADEFGPEAIERIRRRRPARYITADSSSLDAAIEKLR